MKNIDRLEYAPIFTNEPFQFNTKEQKNLASTIKNIPFLSNVSDEALAAFLAKTKTLTYPKRAVIVSEGDMAHLFCIILSGKVRLFCSDGNHEVTINILGENSYFGEETLFSDNNSPVSIVAQEKTVCLVISKSDLSNWLLSYVDGTINLVDALSWKVIQLTNKIRQLALLNVYERVIEALKDMTVDEGNINQISNRLSQQDLAYMVGASREMVGKVMQELTKGGYIKIENKALIINKQPPPSW